MFYHILIETNETKQISEFDIEEINTLKQDYVLPYLRNIEFSISDFFIDPSKIIRFIIMESDENSTECFNASLSKTRPTENKIASKYEFIFSENTRTRNITKKVFKEVKKEMETSNNLFLTKQEKSKSKTIFLGYSYTQIDEEFVSGFKDLLVERGWDVIDGKADGLGSISQAIIDKISICNIAVIVMTKRDEKINGKFTTSSWLLEEKGAALALKKEVGMFVEEGIDDSDIGGIQGDNQRFPFTRNNFLKIVLNFLKIISKNEQ